MSWYIWQGGSVVPAAGEFLALVWAEVLGGESEPSFMDWLHYGCLSREELTLISALWDRGVPVVIRGWPMLRLPSEATRALEPFRWARHLPSRRGQPSD